MGKRRQIYLDSKTDHILEEKSRSSGVSVSELVRRAVDQVYGAGKRLTWEEVFAHSVTPNTATDEEIAWVYRDRLFNEDEEDLIDQQMDEWERKQRELGRHAPPGL